MVDVDATSKVGDDLLHAGRPIAFLGTDQCNGFAGFVGHQVSDHPDGFGQPDGEIGGNLRHFFKGFRLDASLDSFTQQPGQFGRRSVLTLVVEFDPTVLDVNVRQTPPVAGDLRTDLDEICKADPPFVGRGLAKLVHGHASHGGGCDGRTAHGFHLGQVGVGYGREVACVLNQQLLSSCRLSLRPASDEPLVFAGAHHQASVVERERLDEAPLLGVNVAADDLNALLGLHRVDETDACPLASLFHPRPFQQFVQVDAVSNSHVSNPIRSLRKERIPGQGDLIRNGGRRGGDGHGGRTGPRIMKFHIGWSS